MTVQRGEVVLIDYPYATGGGAKSYGTTLWRQVANMPPPFALRPRATAVSGYQFVARAAGVVRGFISCSSRSGPSGARSR